MKEFRCPHLNNALLKAPVYETHYRGKNWLAVIDVDGAAPGGLSRKFLPYAKGDCLYMIEQISLFDAVEFGADYTTSMGKTNPKRVYGVVVAFTESELVVRQYESGVDACVAARKARETPADKLRALEEARAAHAARVSKLEEEIAVLKGGSS